MATEDSNAAQNEKQESVSPRVLETQITKDPNFQSYYTNFVQAGFTPFDISLLIGEAAGIDPATNKFMAELKAKITMSPTEAKVVLKIMLDTINAYEAQFGKIVIPSVVETTTGDIKPEGS